LSNLSKVLTISNIELKFLQRLLDTYFPSIDRPTGLKLEAMLSDFPGLTPAWYLKGICGRLRERCKKVEQQESYVWPARKKRGRKIGRHGFLRLRSSPPSAFKDTL
jgi:hypothetical protein